MTYLNLSELLVQIQSDFTPAFFLKLSNSSVQKNYAPLNEVALTANDESFNHHLFYSWTLVKIQNVSHKAPYVSAWTIPLLQQR